MSIDHEAAKELARQTTEDINASEPARFVSRALLDLHEQLSAERARVDALAELVPVAYTTGRCAGMAYYEIGPDSPGFSFYESGAQKELSRLMEGRTNA